VIGQPEISTDGFLPYRNSIRDTFGDTASHGVIVKTYSVTHLVKEAQGRYAPASVADTVPYHLRRYVANQPNVPVAHFSILTEMTQLLIAPMEIMG